MPDDGTEGQLRLSRTGGRFTAWYWRDGWQELVRDDDTTGPVTLRLQTVAWYVDEPARLHVDELSLATTGRPELVDLGEYRDDFSDGYVDARLVGASDAGIVAELDGELHLEKVEGRAGRVGLRLDRARWRLRGDGEVSFAFFLDHFPVPERGGAFLSLRVESPRGGSFGTIEIKQKRDGREFKALYHAEVRRAPTSVAEGRLRIRRGGTSLFFEYFDGAWHTLLERPHVAEDVELTMLFELVAPESEKRYVARLDDLAVTFLAPR